MTNQILPTKIYIPQPRNNLVTRPRLLNRLAAGLDGKLTLVSAPAGYGKSTLLAEWVRQSGLSTAWLSLETSDNDPLRFWGYFVAALRNIPFLGSAQIGELLLELLRASPTPEHETLFGELITDLAAIPQQFVLVLDDFHTVTDPQILDGLFFLLENLTRISSGIHLVIACRSDPPWPLARLRVRGQIGELRASDLRFTQDEAALFFNQVMQLSLSSRSIAELDRRTEGWVAGLQMAALSIQGREDIADFLEGFTGSHRFVLDYLMEEVLSQQTSATLDFLLKTSILDRFSGPLCAAVTGDPASPEILLRLEKANMFLVALDDQRIWYRYHHLFADLLQKQLKARSPERLTELHRRASHWYAQSGSPPEAVAHALKTQDWSFAAAQMETYVLDMIQHGEITLVSQWISSLPEDVIRPRPILCIAQAWTSARYASVELAEQLLAQAEAGLSKDLSEDGEIALQDDDLLSRQIAVLQVVIARARGDSTRDQQELALKTLDHVSLAGDTSARATLLLRLGFCYLDLGKDEQADRIFSQAIELGQTSGNYYTAHSAAYGRMVIARRHGTLHELSAICRKTLDSIPGRGDEQASLMGIALTMLGGLYYEWNDLDAAERLLTQGLRLVQQVGIAELLVKGHFSLSCVKLARGEQLPLPDLEKIAEGGNPDLGLLAAALQARLVLLQGWGDPNCLIQWEPDHWARSQQLTLRGQPTYDWEIYEKLVYARVLHRQHQARADANNPETLEEVLNFLQDQLITLEKLDWKGTLLEVWVVTAIILQSLERKAEALTALERALRLAEPQGFVRTFLDEREPMRGLIRQARSEGICEAYAQELLAAFNGSTAAKLMPKAQPKDLIEEFSQRELQVLRLLNTQLSVPEIAMEIHLAPTTVRTHVQNIYRKLDVHGRIAALQRAGELGLL